MRSSLTEFDPPGDLASARRIIQAHGPSQLNKNGTVRPDFRQIQHTRWVLQARLKVVTTTLDGGKSAASIGLFGTKSQHYVDCGTLPNWMNTTKMKADVRATSSALQAGMTLTEVVMSLAITGMVMGGIVGGYTFCTTSAEKAALSLAASARAMERIEEARSAKWDTSSWPAVDQLVATNFPDKVVTLDLSGSGAGARSATIRTEISPISVTPPLKRIRVDCIWKFRGAEVITNTIETCRAPDQ